LRMAQRSEANSLGD